MNDMSGNRPMRPFPTGLGASAVWQVGDARKLTLFVVDQSIPLYNVVIGSLRFFANADQIIEFVDWLDAAPQEPPSHPTWKWVFESGFDQSIDGSRSKGWRLKHN
ncbi:MULTISPECIES: hypothetical protein [unclassified Caballeronia]|uniref:hypothetical protein n=1 Tax=unclassified Caballeronia TaxID=2646786 RepID=UPI0020278D9D|nr:MULTISPECIES: hypothetical protein [unclassified Caballeronia]